MNIDVQLSFGNILTEWYLKKFNRYLGYCVDKEHLIVYGHFEKTQTNLSNETFYNDCYEKVKEVEENLRKYFDLLEGKIEAQLAKVEGYALKYPWFEYTLTFDCDLDKRYEILAFIKMSA